MTRSVTAGVIALMANVVCSTSSASEPKHAPISCIVITANGRQLVESSQAAIRVRETETLNVTAECVPQADKIHDVQFAPDEKSVAVVGGNVGEFAVVTLYSWPGMHEVWRQQFAEDVVYSASFSTDGKTIAVAGHDHNIYLMDSSDGKTTATLAGHSKPVIDAIFLNADLLVSCSRDQTIRVWNMNTKQIVRSLNNHTRAVTDVALRPDVEGSLPLMVSGGEDRTIRFWQPTIGRMVKFKRIASPANFVVFSPDPRFAVAGCRDGAVRVINVSTLESRAVPTGVDGWVNCLVMLPNSQVAIVGGSDGSVRRVDLAAKR